jgi:opacity protein-like surface antigen
MILTFINTSIAIENKISITFASLLQLLKFRKLTAIIKIHMSIILSAFCVPLFSQESNGLLTPIHKSEIGISAGISYYIGDFNESVIPYMISPTGGLLYRYNFTKYINMRIQASYGIVKGDSHKYESGLQGFPEGVNLAFKRNFYNINAFAEFNFFPFSSVDPKRKQIFTPFLIIGAGYSYFDKNKVDNEPYLSAATAAYPMLYDSIKTASSVILPVGFGFKYSPANQWTVGIECVFYKTNTDKMDFYTNRSDTNSFNIFNKDWVSTMSLTVSYRFIDKMPCASYKTNKSTKKRNYIGFNKELY